MNDLENLLTSLEEVSARAAESSDPELQGTANVIQVCELVSERGELIEQLQPLLVSRSPMSHMEWNRLVVIHQQGARIQDNLNRVRSQVAMESGTSYSGRVFLERVSGMLTQASNQD